MQVANLITTGAKFIFASAILTLGMPAHAATAGEVQVWLYKMAHTLANRNYEGTFIYQSGDRLEAMRIIHAVHDGSEYERLVALNGTAREIIRNRSGVTCILPDKQAVMTERGAPRASFFPSLAKADSKLAHYYNFTLLGEDRMTGQDALIVAIQPKDQYRYGYRLWLSADSAMLLKSDLLSEQGVVVEQMMFTDIDLLDEVPSDALRPQTTGIGYHWRHDDTGGEAVPPERRHWQAQRLPSGFVLLHYNAQHSPVREHLVFSDGLASVSAYIETPPADNKPNASGAARMGAVNTYSTEHGQHQITVVGEVPEITVRTIALGLQPLSAAAP